MHLYVRAIDAGLSIRITDQDSGKPTSGLEPPDLQRKLEGVQQPRGWGMLLIKTLVDEVVVTSDGGQHTVELLIYLPRSHD